MTTTTRTAIRNGKHDMEAAAPSKLSEWDAEVRRVATIAINPGGALGALFATGSTGGTPDEKVLTFVDLARSVFGVDLNVPMPQVSVMQRLNSCRATMTDSDQTPLMIYRYLREGIEAGVAAGGGRHGAPGGVVFPAALPADAVHVFHEGVGLLKPFASPIAAVFRDKLPADCALLTIPEAECFRYGGRLMLALGPGRPDVGGKLVPPLWITTNEALSLTRIVSAEQSKEMLPIQAREREEQRRAAEAMKSAPVSAAHVARLQEQVADMDAMREELAAAKARLSELEAARK